MLRDVAFAAAAAATASRKRAITGEFNINSSSVAKLN